MKFEHSLHNSPRYSQLVIFNFVLFFLSFFRYFSQAPHPSGSNFSYVQAKYIKEKWEEYGLDKVELKKYDVLLSYPERPGIASITSANGSSVFTAQRKEKVLEDSEDNPDVLPPFNAYSSSGNVTVSVNKDPKVSK